MTMTAEQRQQLNLAFEDLLDVAQIAGIHLVSSRLKSSPAASRKPEDHWGFEHACEVTSILYEEDAKALVGYVDAGALCRVKRKQIAKLSTRYVAIYKVAGKPNDEVAQRFFKSVGAIAVYPYFRAHWAEISAQAGFRFPPLPIMKTPRRAIAAWAKDAKGLEEKCEPK